MCLERYDNQPVPAEGASIARETRINERIRAREVLLIGDDGERLGVVPTAEALQMARERDVDLVEVAPNSVPPVCRMLDFGKYKYEQAKKERGQNKHQHAGGGLHEVRFKVKIGEHDLDLKMRRAEEFLREGDKVKLSVMFRGREILHPEIGQKLLQRVREKLADVAVAERPPSMEGRFMNMFMAPISAKNRPQKERPPAAVEAAAEG